MDWELANPDLHLKECAKLLGVTQTYLSIIRNSDAFIEYRAKRRIEHNENVSVSVVERTEELAGLTLEVLHERIEAERESISLGGVKETCDMALKALGFGGARGGDATQVNIVIGADAETLSRARETLRSINQANAEGVEHDTARVPAPT